MKTNLVVELYIDGHPINFIAEELSMSESEVLTILRSYKIKKESGRGYIQYFKEMIVGRIISGVRKSTISRELGIAHRTIDNYLEEFVIETPPSKKSLEKNMYEEIDWTSFTVCPNCNGNNVNDLNIYKDEGYKNHKHSYCLSCGTEWEKRGKKVYKIRWEYVE